MNNYEGLFIIKSGLKEEEVKNVSKAITDSISKSGGSIKKEESWGKRQLAYPVKKFRDGHYYKVDFEAPPETVVKLETACKLNLDILRTMITRR